MVPSGCNLGGRRGAAPEVVLLTDHGDGPVLRSDSTHDGPDALCKQPETGAAPSELPGLCPCVCIAFLLCI